MYESNKDLLKQRENEIPEKEEIQRGELDSVATFSWVYLLIQVGC